MRLGIVGFARQSTRDHADVDIVPAGTRPKRVGVLHHGSSGVERAATERNLQNAGYQGYSALYMRPEGIRYASAADFKAPVRAAIETAGYAIIANVGDQPSESYERKLVTV